MINHIQVKNEMIKIENVIRKNLVGLNVLYCTLRLCLSMCVCLYDLCNSPYTVKQCTVFKVSITFYYVYVITHL